MANGAPGPQQRDTKVLRNNSNVCFVPIRSHKEGAEGRHRAAGHTGGVDEGTEQQLLSNGL